MRPQLGCQRPCKPGCSGVYICNPRAGGKVGTEGSLDILPSSTQLSNHNPMPKSEDIINLLSTRFIIKNHPSYCWPGPQLFRLYSFWITAILHIQTEILCVTCVWVSEIESSVGKPSVVLNSWWFSCLTLLRMYMHQHARFLFSLFLFIS